MPGRAGFIVEIGWLIVSTALFLAIAARETGSWRWAWVALMVLNVGVVGYRAMRARPRRVDGGPAVD